jgi:hypothetical protein
MLYWVVANNRREAMIRKLWSRAAMLVGAVTMIGVASAASAAPAKAQPPVVVVRPGYGYHYGYGPRVVVVEHPYWHTYRWYDYRFHGWRFRREWR